MRIYLDNCCYNRPYDDQSQIRISLEAQAKLFIQNEIKAGTYDLITSFILDYEVEMNPHSSTKAGIREFIDNYSHYHVSDKKKSEIEIKAEEIQKTGVKKMDALHVACALMAKADYFLTTDDRLLKYQSKEIKIENPISFANEEDSNDK